MRFLDISMKDQMHFLVWYCNQDNANAQVHKYCLHIAYSAT